MKNIIFQWQKKKISEPIKTHKNNDVIRLGKVHSFIFLPMDSLLRVIGKCKQIVFSPQCVSFYRQFIIFFLFFLIIIWCSKFCHVTLKNRNLFGYLYLLLYSSIYRERAIWLHFICIKKLISIHMLISSFHEILLLLHVFISLIRQVVSPKNMLLNS